MDSHGNPLELLTESPRRSPGMSLRKLPATLFNRLLKRLQGIFPLKVLDLVPSSILSNYVSVIFPKKEN